MEIKILFKLITLEYLTQNIMSKTDNVTRKSYKKIMAVGRWQ